MDPANIPPTIDIFSLISEVYAIGPRLLPWPIEYHATLRKAGPSVCRAGDHAR
jgi:hypothetical protein